MTTTIQTAERTTFLSDLLLTGLAASDYWGTATNIITDAAGRTVSATIVDFDDQAHHITLNTVATGLRRIKTGKIGFHNPGYQESQKRLATLDRTNGDDSDYDAIDADAIIQAGALNELTYG